MINTIKKNKNEMLSFSIYMFCFLLIEQIINDNIGIKLGNNFVLIIYSISIFFTGLGYLSLSLFNKTNKKTINIIMEILFITSIILNYIFHNYLCILFSIMTTFSFGYIGANVHWKISQSLSNSKTIGKTIGISTSTALALQMFVYNLIKNSSLLIIIIIIMTLLLFRKLDNIKTINLKPNEFKKNKIHKLIPIIIVAVISIILGLQDAIITSMDSLKHINVYGIPRLFYIVGILIAGFIADKENGKYLGITTMICVLISICGIPLLKFEPFYIANSSLIFLSSGFYVMYLTVKFINIAPYTKNPTLWAGMGRIVRSLTISIVVIPADILFKKYGADILIIISIIFSAILIITLYKELVITLYKEQELSIEDFINKFNFTPKEKEVCKLILKENKKTKEISQTLYISERSVQRHLTSIYQKTNTSSRSELYKLFYNI